MSTLSWNDSTKTWSWTGFSVKTDNGYDDGENGYYENFWGYGIRKRLVGDSTWSTLYSSYMVLEGTYTKDVSTQPQYQPVAGYEYQGFRVNFTGYSTPYSEGWAEPSNIIAPLGGGVTPLDIQMKSVDGLSETTVLATVVGGVVIHAISGKADALGETTVLTTVIGGTPSSYALAGTVRVGGAITPNVRVIAVKTDGSKVFTAISNSDGTFSVNVEQGTYQVLGVYTDGSNNKYSSLITPYVAV